LVLVLVVLVTSEWMRVAMLVVVVQQAFESKLQRVLRSLRSSRSKRRVAARVVVVGTKKVLVLVLVLVPVSMLLTCQDRLLLHLHLHLHLHLLLLLQPCLAAQCLAHMRRTLLLWKHHLCPALFLFLLQTCLG